MNESRPVKLIRIGAKQVIEVPPTFELPGTDAVMRKQGDSLIIDSEKKKKKSSLQELLASWEPLDEECRELADPPPEPFDL